MYASRGAFLILQYLQKVWAMTEYAKCHSRILVKIHYSKEGYKITTDSSSFAKGADSSHYPSGLVSCLAHRTCNE